MKSVRADLDSASLEQGAFHRDKVRDQATALAEKKKRGGAAKKRGEKEQEELEEQEEEEEDDSNEGISGRFNGNEDELVDCEDEDEVQDKNEEASNGVSENSSENDGDDDDGVHRARTGISAQPSNVVLAPRPGQGMMSRDANKKIQNARKGLRNLADLRAALVAITSLWKQAKSKSDKSGCECQVVALGQSIYNCGVYSEIQKTREDSSELLDKLAGMLRSSNKDPAKGTTDAIELLCSDLKG